MEPSERIPLTLHDIKANFIQLVAVHQKMEEAIESKIQLKRKQLERFEKQLKKLPSFPRWTELLLRPIIEQIKPNLPGWNCDDEHLTPMGLGSRVSVFFTNKKDSERYIYIVFVPMDVSKGKLNYETGKAISRFGKDTIGEINGFNRETKLIASINELIIFLKKQILTN